MAVSTATNGIGAGITVALTAGTQGVIFDGTELLDVQWSGITRESVETTHQGTSVSAGTARVFGSREFIPKLHTDPGELTLTYHFNPDLSVPPIEDAATTITITWPGFPSTETGATWASSGFCTGFTVNSATVDDKMTCDATFKLSGVVTTIKQA